MATTVRRFLFVILSLSLYVTSHPLHPHDERDHVETFARVLPGQWYHDESHPVNALFKRQDPPPQPGTAEWAAAYPPPGSMTEDRIPQAWLDALHAAEAAGLIPDIPVSSGPNNSNPTYPQGNDPTGPEICSATYKCRMPDDVWDAPDGTVSIGFDDGPEEGSPLLYDFLEQNKIPSTHFMIGSNIIYSYALFQRAFSELQADIAVHTWTHRHMTTLSNEVALGELAWTMKIIADSTGGRIPKYWRPPYGDSDNRIRAIAKYVLGLVQINWNQDSEDWTISTGQTTRPDVEKAISGWYAGPKTPGLMILEHELTNDTSGAFISTFPGIAENGWKLASTIQLLGGSWKNAQGNTDDVQSMDLILPKSAAPSSASSSSTALPPTSAFNAQASETPHTGPSISKPPLQASASAAAAQSDTFSNSASQLWFKTSSSSCTIFLSAISLLALYL